MQILLVASPKETQAAAKHGCQLAHAAYRIGSNSTLLRQNLPLQTRGGILSVGDQDAPFIENAEALCAAVLRECNRWSYSGAVLDFEEPPRQDRILFAQQLGRILKANQRALYLPESYAKEVPSAVMLIGTAISGGNLCERLDEVIHQRNGTKGLALDVERLRMDFTLPSPTGIGTPLSTEEFQALIKREAPTIFFSQDLCARYFTYSHRGEAHFVLFDDASTLRKKLQMGQTMGFSAAFLMWPEISDIAEELNLRANVK